MARFYGRVGFGHTVEVRPGVKEDVITERKFFGDVLRPSRSFREDGQVHRNTEPSNRISVLADDYATENVYAIRFVEWKGVLWYVTKVDEERPRLIFSLGEVYHGPVAASDAPD
jgi:hypothetical protein